MSLLGLRSIQHQQHVCYPTFFFKSFVTLVHLLQTCPFSRKKKEKKRVSEVCSPCLLTTNICAICLPAELENVWDVLYHRSMSDQCVAQTQVCGWCVLPKFPFSADHRWMMRPLVPKDLARPKGCVEKTELAYTEWEDARVFACCDWAVTRVFDWLRSLFFTVSYFFGFKLIVSTLSRHYLLKCVSMCRYMKI
jgi:hypothetical protein